eukprot:1177197-Prorocentrum_minimum.AAC.3
MAGPALAASMFKLTMEKGIIVPTKHEVSTIANRLRLIATQFLSPAIHRIDVAKLATVVVRTPGAMFANLEIENIKSKRPSRAAARMVVDPWISRPRVGPLTIDH